MNLCIYSLYPENRGAQDPLQGKHAPEIPLSPVVDEALARRNEYGVWELGTRTVDDNTGASCRRR